MRQYRITSANILAADENDCVLSPDDPMYELIKTSTVGGIGTDAAIAKYAQRNAAIDIKPADAWTPFRGRKK